jgi:phosphoglycolate phosphatase-like HAD superfamily hydrolase
MPYDTIISDWNGTITTNNDEKALFETIAKDLFKASIPFHLIRAARLINVRAELETLYWRGRQDAEFDFAGEMFKVYNPQVVNGLPISFIHRSVSRYAARRETQRRLDHRILRPIRSLHQGGKTTGILSSGYAYGIDRILTVAGFRRYFDFRIANSFKQESGRATEFSLEIYRNKHHLLLQALRHRNLDEKRTVYIGNSEDDEGCFIIARYPIVAFSTTEEQKQRCALRYRAFVPEDERDLANYLRSI